ncbi:MULTISPECIES: hypothetical protein [unclassified Kitasatospora]|uniref:hypothetical protein n=1 Tax=unclassified Kitasatospora TaxID=2633591 RepID=UPI0024749177|nr:hypothetical protein [Kitasatospora sp. MAP12-44]
MPVDLAAELVSYDAVDVSIRVRRGANPEYVMAEISAILSDLDAPSAAVGALCFCGDPITLPPELLAQQAGCRDDRRQVLRGA